MITNGKPVRIDPELYKKLKIAAKGEDRSVTNLVNRVIEKWLDGTIIGLQG